VEFDGVKGNILTHGLHNILDNMEYTKEGIKTHNSKVVKILSLLPNSNIDILNSGRQWQIAGGLMVEYTKSLCRHTAEGTRFKHAHHI